MLKDITELRGVVTKMEWVGKQFDQAGLEVALSGLAKEW
jgi:hypothetical protein